MIAARDLQIAYDGQPVLSDIQLELPARRFLCLIGRNGSGKSTLLRALAGLQAYSGAITLDGQAVQALAPRLRAQRIAYLPQTRPVPRLDVETLIAHGRFPHLGLSKRLRDSDRQHIRRAAEQTDVSHLLHRELGQLSGGERQRVYIAMMVAQDADWLLLDEPTTHLDIEHQLEILTLLKRIHAAGRSIILVAHDLPQAFSIAERMILLGSGRILADGSPAQLAQHPALKQEMGVWLKAHAEPDEIYHYRLMRVAAESNQA